MVYITIILKFRNICIYYFLIYIIIIIIIILPCFKTLSYTEFFE